jgi:ABC-type oligopeptide transport system substrate-binding subunit
MIESLLGDRYHVSAEIGRGGMSVVYRAFDTLLDRPVAVKVLDQTSLEPESWARLMREAKAAAQLNHPNIVSVYDAGEVDGWPYIVMELVEGVSLHQYGPQGLDDIVAIACQICAALAHAHKHGVIHRDLKPENVLFTSSGVAKLTDFGLARSRTSRLTSEATIVGTVFYLAPELALGRDFDGRADLYALGVMLYELTTGRLPFVGEDPLAVISQHLHDSPAPPRARNDQLPPNLDALIVNLLSKDPADRPASAEEVRRILESGSILDTDVASTKELSVLQRIERGRLVGRERELEEARALWTRVLSGQGQVLLIQGEPGVGKTRLAREIATQAEISGGRVLTGASYIEGNAPYGPLRQIVPQVLLPEGERDLNLPEDVLADLLTLSPELRLHYPEISPHPPLEPMADQQRLLENLHLFLTALSEDAPLLIVLEDIHWADSGTLSALRYLARHARRQRVMWVATYCDVGIDEARTLHKVLLDLTRERLATHIRLPRLNREETQVLLAALFGQEMTPDFRDAVYDETEGNPFFIEEVVKALVENGQMTYKNGRWHRAGREVGLPHGVRVAIQSRVGELPATAQATLRLAATLGRCFDFETLAEASELEMDALIDALRLGEQAQLIKKLRSERGEFTFVHGMIATTLVEALSATECRRLHLQAGAAIEHQCPEDFEALAYHYSQAGEPERATHYLLQAGDRARRLYAHQEAANNYHQALALLKEAGDLERAARTLMKLGLNYHNAFEFKAARQAYEEGFVLWQKRGTLEPVATPPPAPHALRVSLPRPTTLDPGLATDDPSIVTIGQLFSGLVELSPEMDVVPDVCRHWDVLDGGHRYVFYLRDDARWSDGSAVTARDFEYAWKRALNPGTGAATATYLYDIKGARAYHQGQENDPRHVAVDALDETTLAVELERPTSYFLHLLTRTPTFPVPRHAVGTHGAAWTEPGNIVTNGPFTLAALRPGESLVLERNPRYHRRWTGNLLQLELVEIENQSELWKRYQDGTLDILYLAYLPPRERHRARHQYAGDYISGPMLWSQYICLNLSRPPFADGRVRKALTMATDRETLAHVGYRGYLFPATGGLVPPGMPGHTPGIGLPFDPEQARSLLAEAGYSNGCEFPPLEACSVTGFETVTQCLQAQWLENLGMNITWVEMDWATFLDRLASRRPHMWIDGWSADYPDPDNFLRVASWRMDVGWENEAFDLLVNEARRVLNQSERLKMYQQADEILIEEAVVMPLAYGRAHWLVKPWVTRFPTSPIGGHFWRDVIIEPH